MNIEDLRIKFEAKWLAVLKPFKATTDIRYYLCGICVEKAPQGGVYLAATDGHALCVIYDKDGECNSDGPVTLACTPDLFVKAKQARTFAGIPAQVVVTGKRLSVALNYESAQTEMENYVQPGNCRVEGKFPDWRRVLPRWDQLKPGCMREGKNGINPVYFSKIAELTKGDRFANMALWQEDDEHAVVVQMLSKPEALVIVMPMRDSFRSIDKHYGAMGLSGLKSKQPAEPPEETVAA